MSQTNSGQNLSDRPTEETETEKKWKEIEQKLNDYQNNLALSIHKNNRVIEILNLDIEQLRNLQAEDCGIYSFLLTQYSTFLQKEINRHQAKNKWANHNIDIMIGKYGCNYGDKYTKLEERKLMLIADNSYAKALYDMVKFSSVICEDLSFMAKKVEIMANHLSELQRSKRTTYEQRRTT